ncbi:C45 family peptidase [Kutzneria albida]|nr:C45 family peptidase [Kutzneria albida]
MTFAAGSPEDFMAVRHVVLRGSQYEIGRALARQAPPVRPVPIDPAVGAARRTWFERNWPQHLARTAGIAEQAGFDPSRDDLALDGLGTLPSWSGCSAVFDGKSTLGRNYDFFTLAEDQMEQVIQGEAPRPSEQPPWASRPYVITTVPEDGLASTVLTMANLDGATEGINESGLAVALLIGDIENARPAPGGGPKAGLSLIQLVRFLLDTCEDVEQAKRALLGAKQYDDGLRCHYLVADASGAAFVWERGAHDSEHVVEVADGPLCVTNHPLHQHPDVSALPADTPESFLTYQRLRTLTEHLGDPVRESLDLVAVPSTPDSPWCTLWRTVFDLPARTMSVRFWLGADRHSEEIVFGAGR